MINKNYFFILILFLIIFDLFLWWQILFVGFPRDTQIYAFAVGQGDSELIIFPGRVKVLIDGGPDNKIIQHLDSLLPLTDRYLDIVILSHPQADHFAGLIDVLKRYEVGVFVSSGKYGQAKSFNDLIDVLNKKKIVHIFLGANDKIKYQDHVFEVLSPTIDLLKTKEPNNWSLVLKLISQRVVSLFTGDIDFQIEDQLLQRYNLKIDILKVAHHGSRFSSSKKFLEAIRPKIAVIEVGQNNYGHPHPLTLKNLSSVANYVLRTDKDGNIKFVLSNGRIQIFKH